jgi:hypothetical protein
MDRMIEIGKTNISNSDPLLQIVIKLCGASIMALTRIIPLQWKSVTAGKSISVLPPSRYHGDNRTAEIQ